MSRDQRAGHVRREDEDAADERGQRERIADDGEDILRRFVVGADDLADDGGGGAVEGHANRAQEEDDRPGRQTRGVVARGVNVGAVGETESGHRKRNGAEKYTDTVVHVRMVFPPPSQSPYQADFSYL